MSDLVEMEHIGQVEHYLLALQDELCAALEAADGAERFREDNWKRDSGGGGRTRVMENGALFEQAGVNFSLVHGDNLPPSATAARPELAGRSWRAMGVSLVPLILKNQKQQFLQRDIVGRASFKRRYFLYHNWEWKLVYFAELDLLQLFNVVTDPKEKNNLINEDPELAARLEKSLFDYLKRVEGKTYRSVLSSSKTKETN